MAKAKEWEELRAELDALPVDPAATESNQGQTLLPRLPKPGRTAVEQVRALHVMFIAHLHICARGHEKSSLYPACQRKVSVVHFAINHSESTITNQTFFRLQSSNRPKIYLTGTCCPVLVGELHVNEHLALVLARTSVYWLASFAASGCIAVDSGDEQP